MLPDPSNPSNQELVPYAEQSWIDLSKLQPGWADGRGGSPDPKELAWLRNRIENASPAKAAAPPHVYPTSGGDVWVEWNFFPFEVSLRVVFSTRVGWWHSINIEDDLVESQTVLDLNWADDLVWLKEKLESLSGGRTQ